MSAELTRPAAGVLAEDLRALADGPFDPATVVMLGQAADVLDEHAGLREFLRPRTDPDGPSSADRVETLHRRAVTAAVRVLADDIEHPPDDPGVPDPPSGEPLHLDVLTYRVACALDCAALRLAVIEHDDTLSPLRRLVRCLRSNGLLDEGDMVPVRALQALAAGVAVDEVVDEFDPPDGALLRLVAPLVRRDAPTSR